MENYRVKLQVFEGPLDLLLHLIKINEMEIHDIRIAEITSQYLTHLRLMEKLDLEVAGDILVMASTLVNIKLRSLLPDAHDDADEDEEVGDIMTAQSLMEKLVEYRKFKEAASALEERGHHQSQVFFRDVALPRFSQAQGDESMEVELDSLLVAFSRVLRFVEQRGWHLVTEEEFSVEEKMDDIEQRLLMSKRIDVEELFKECHSKMEMIVYLLAMLELFHERRASVEQAEAFGPIYIFAPPPDKRAEDQAPEGEPVGVAVAEVAPILAIDESAQDSTPRPAAQIVELNPEGGPSTG